MVIEKISNGNLTFWRTYHSCMFIFNLNHWVGNGYGPKLPSKNSRDMCNKFGHGKLLNDKQVEELLKKMTAFFIPSETDYYLYIKKFNVAKPYSLFPIKQDSNKTPVPKNF
jgi:hypothetical protein